MIAGSVQRCKNGGEVESSEVLRGEKLDGVHDGISDELEYDSICRTTMPTFTPPVVLSHVGYIRRLIPCMM